MSTDPCTDAAIIWTSRKYAKPRAYSPGSWYEGDRPNLNWPAFLMLLFRNGHGAPRIRRTIRPAR